MAGRGRPLTYEEIVCDLRDDGKLEWHKTFVVFAKTSIEGKTLRGFCYKKTIAHPVIDTTTMLHLFGAYKLERVYATRKEVFQDKLRNEYNDA